MPDDPTPPPHPPETSPPGLACLGRRRRDAGRDRRLRAEPGRLAAAITQAAPNSGKTMEAKMRRCARDVLLFALIWLLAVGPGYAGGLWLTLQPTPDMGA